MKEGTLVDLAAFKQDFNVVDADGPPMFYNADTLVAGGIKKEGDDFPFICPTPQKAIALYLKSLEDYLKERSIHKNCNIIIWRTRPEIVVFTIKGGKKKSWIRHYQVYSRLVAY